MATAAPVTEEEIRCPVCFETFDKKLHEPKRLMCPHSICVTCVKNLPEPVKCPVCKREVTVPIDDLARDIVTLRLLQSNTCTECDKLGELRTCKRCKIRLCELCERRHRTPDHCQISENVKAMGEKLDTEAVKKVMTKKASSVEATKKNIDEMFEGIEAALAARKQDIHAVAKAACELDDETLKIQSAPEVMTRATLLLEAKKTQNAKLKKMLQETNDLKRLLSDPTVMAKADELVEKLQVDVEKLKSDIKNLGQNIEPSVINTVAPVVPDYAAKRRVKQKITVKPEGRQPVRVIGLAECSEMGRVFVACKMIVYDDQRFPIEKDIVHIYENWIWSTTIPVNRRTKLIFVYGGRLYVVSESCCGNGYFLSAFDPQTENMLHNCYNDHIFQFCASKSGQLFGHDVDGHVILEFSLTGQVIREIQLQRLPATMGRYRNFTVNSECDFLVCVDDTKDRFAIKVFSNTGQYKDQITTDIPSYSRDVAMTTDDQDKVLTLVEGSKGNFRTRLITSVHLIVRDRNLRKETTSDLRAIGIGRATNIMTTQTGDLVVAGTEETYDDSQSNKLFIL